MRGVFLMALLAAGCPGRTSQPGGSDSDSERDGGFTTCEPDSARLVTLIDNPTGTLSSAADAQGVAEEYAAATLAPQGLTGRRRPGISCGGEPLADGRLECVCPGGGSLVGTVETFGYRYALEECCLAESCCYDGCGWAEFQTGAYSSCTSFNLSESCRDGALVETSFCMDRSGRSNYLVAFRGGTYAVSGFYDSASGGSWTVRDAVAEWRCSQDATGAGSCTNGSATLDWT